MRRAAVYKIENINGKVYIGSTAHLEGRWACHRNLLRAGKHINRHLQSAWNQDGESSFHFLVLEDIKDTALLLAREQCYMDLYVSYDALHGYNLCRIAGSTIGRRLSQEARAKIADARRGKPGRPHSEETKAKIGAAHRGKPKRPLTDEEKRRLSEIFTNRTVSDETKARMSIAAKLAHERWPRKKKSSKTKSPPRTIEMLQIVCVDCGSPFIRRAKTERYRNKKRASGPFCGKLCRNRAAAKKRHTLKENS